MATDSILRPGELKDILLREIAAADLSTTDVSEVGTVLEVRITAPDTMGKVLRYTIRSKRPPTRRTLCLTPGTTQPGRCS